MIAETHTRSSGTRKRLAFGFGKASCKIRGINSSSYYHSIWLVGMAISSGLRRL